MEQGTNSKRLLPKKVEAIRVYETRNPIEFYLDSNRDRSAFEFYVDSDGGFRMTGNGIKGQFLDIFVQKPSIFLPRTIVQASAVIEVCQQFVCPSR